MKYNKAQMEAALHKWEEGVLNFTLPSWEELPAIELYMDQVVMYLSQRLEPYLDGKPMTASTINNYVRTKVMPPPNKKRYSRLHLAFLMMICSLRQSMSIAAIGLMIPYDLPESEFRELYHQFVTQHRGSSLFFVRHLRPSIAALGDAASNSRSEISELVASSAVISVLSKMLTEYMLNLDDSPPVDD